MFSSNKDLKCIEAEEDFFQQASVLANRVRNAIVSKRSVDPHIEGLSEIAYVAASDGTVLKVNSACLASLKDDVGPIGTTTSPYMDASMALISKLSNEMLVAGAKDIVYRQMGRFQGGELTNFTTFKASLLGLGHPQMAILVVVQMTPCEISAPEHRLMTLQDAWQEFSELKSRDQHIAVALAHGEKVKAIADQLSVSEKTIENARTAILKRLSLEHPAELIKLMVRFHDGGFRDFNL